MNPISIVIRMVLFGVLRRLLGLPGLALLGIAVWAYFKTNFGG